MHPLTSQSVASSLTEQDVMVARQPIYNNRMGVFGYELFFHSPDATTGSQVEKQATIQVLTNAVLSFELNELICNRNAVINVTHEILETIAELPLPVEQIILSLPENISIDEHLIVQLKALKKKGFHLSVEGLDNLNNLRPLLRLADIFRIDIHQIKDGQLDKLIKFLSNFGQLSLLALKIETMEQYRLYCDKGFDYLQGNFLSIPREYVSRELPANKLSILSLLATVQDGDAELADIERVISQDVALSYKMLKLINSPFFGVSQTVHSVRQAIVILGRDELRRWISLLALSNMSDEPIAKIEIALLRARLCELLAARVHLPGDGFFTVGMFSALDILMKSNINHILEKLPLSGDIKAAILQHQGMQGEALSCALAVEKVEWNNFRFQQLNRRDIVEAFRDAVQWTNQVINSF